MIDVALACVVAVVGAFVVLGIVFGAFRDVTGRRIGSDGYPDRIDLHREQCQCVRCLGVLHRNIDRLERELGIGEYEGREESGEGRIVTGATFRLTADRITADQIVVGHSWPPKVTDE